MIISRVLLCGPAEPRELFLTEDASKFPRGSGGVPVNLLARALTARGIQVTLVSSSRFIESNWSHTQGLLTLHMVPMREKARDRALDFFKSERVAMQKLIEEIDFQVLHAHWTYEYALAALSANKSALVTAHDAPIQVFRYFRDAYRFFRLIMAIQVRFQVSNLTFVSPYLKSRWRNEMLWRKVSSVIPNIAPFESVSNMEKRSVRTHVISIGDAHELKNIKSLLLAWPSVLKSVPQAKLHLVGDGLGPDSELRKWVSDEAVFESLHWHGFLDRPNLLDVLSSAVLMVHPSYEESQPVSLIEAMQFGIPIVGGINSGGVPWTVKDSGLLVDISKPAEIAEAIIQLLLDGSKREKLGFIARQRAKKVFSTQAVTDMYIQEYERILANYV